MSRRWAGAVLALAAGVSAARAQPSADQDRIWQQWALNCQGCHQPEGLGAPGATPPLKGQVARFTSTPEGRAYLGRVPGVANAPLSDAELAALLNWLLVRFDAGHLSPAFRPYTAEELNRLRARPLRNDAAAARADLVRRWSTAPNR